jgi:hypothetical protein
MRRGLDGFSCFLPSSSAVFKLHGGCLEHFRWRDSERETPLPIPNRAVKPLSADGTWRATARESRSPPVLSRKPPLRAAFVVQALSAIGSLIKRSSRACSQQKSRPEAALSLPAWRALPDRIASRGPAVRAPDDPKRRFARARRPDRATGAANLRRGRKAAARSPAPARARCRTRRASRSRSSGRPRPAAALLCL